MEIIILLLKKIWEESPVSVVSMATNWGSQGDSASTY